MGERREASSLVRRPRRCGAPRSPAGRRPAGRYRRVRNGRVCVASRNQPSQCAHAVPTLPHPPAGPLVPSQGAWADGVRAARPNVTISAAFAPGPDYCSGDARFAAIPTKLCASARHLLSVEFDRRRAAVRAFACVRRRRCSSPPASRPAATLYTECGAVLARGRSAGTRALRCPLRVSADVQFGAAREGFCVLSLLYTGSADVEHHERIPDTWRLHGRGLSWFSAGAWAEVATRAPASGNRCCCRECCGQLHAGLGHQIPGAPCREAFPNGTGTERGPNEAVAHSTCVWRCPSPSGIWTRALLSLHVLCALASVALGDVVALWCVSRLSFSSPVGI